MNSYIYKKIIIFQNYLISLDEKHTKLSTLIFFIFIIIESGLLILSFYPDFNLASAIGHDIIFHLNRFYGLSQAIENGSYPFYINSHSLNGYGYAVNLFYPDLTILPFSLIINKLGLVNAYKVMIFSYTVICALFSFFAIKKITSDKLIAYIFTLLYTFSLYRIVDIVGKGAIAEYLAFTFIPLIINGFYEVVYNNYKKWYILSIGYSLLIYTHLLSSLLILIVFTIRAILHNQITFLRFKYLGLSTIVTLLLSTFLVLPMFEQLSSNSFYLQTYPLVSKTTINGSHITLLIKGLIEGINGSKFI